MNCKNCNNSLPEGTKFCGKCGTKVVSDTAEIAQVVKTKTVSGIRIFLGIVVALVVFGILGKALMFIFNIIPVLLFGIDSTEGLKDAEAFGNIIGFVGAAYLANLVYVAIAGKDRSGEKKKWYQFGGFMATGGKTKSRPVLVGVIIAITVIALVLWIGVDSLQMARQKAVDSGQYTASDNWVTYNAPESNFSVKIPSRPVHDTKTQDTANGKAQIDTYKTADDTASVAYIVNVSILPSNTDVSDSAAFLENTVNLSANNGTVLTSNPTTHNGYPAVEYLIEFVHPDTTSRIRGLNVLVGQTLYQLLTAYDKPDESKLEFEKFADSFQIN